MTVASYDPGVFDVATLEEAKDIILCPEEGQSVEARWRRETPYLVELIQQHLPITKDSVLLDYGCGIGRLSRELILKTGCKAIGVDFSVNMRAFAANYVALHHFYACDKAMLNPGCADFALSVWVLQHCLFPADDILAIKNALKPGALFFVVDDRRVVPTNLGWVKDTADVQALLREHFVFVKKIELSGDHITHHLAARTTCSVFQKL
jgi:SAM-dependent methyltransferase